MRPTCLRHLKLIEAIGLTLVLVAWWVQWGSVRHWRDARDSMSAALDTVTSIYSVPTVVTNLNYEAAVTRAVLLSGVSSPLPLNDYEIAWQSDRVRSNWVLAVANRVSRIRTQVDQFEVISGTYGIRSDSLAVLGDGVEELVASYGALLDEEAHFPGRPVPEPDQLTPVQARYIQRKLAVFDEGLGGVAHEFSRQARQRSESASRRYFLMFIVGTGLIAASKVGEWLRESMPPN